jgi:Protein of unknown function (DUF2844)
MNWHWAWCWIAAWLPAMAHASLGDTLPSVDADRVALRASLQQFSDARFSVHEIATPAGTLVREYVSPAGQVFAVAWQGPFMPDLQQTLGSYFGPYQSAVRAARKGRSPVAIVTPTLVVHSGGRLRAFFGVAYLPQALPAGVSAGELH